MSAAQTFRAPDPPTHAGERLYWALADAITIARANLSHIVRVPEQLMDVTVQPIMFVLLFAYVFGSAIALPGGGNYHAYLMPGIYTQSIAFTAAATAVAVSTNMSKGVIDRFRSLPMARSAVLVGETLAALVKSLLGLVVMGACGLVVGWRMQNGPADAALGFLLLLLFGFAMSWFGTFVGLISRQPEAAQVFGFVLLFPMTFVANTFVPTTGMPAALRVIANWNPLSATVAACRKLFGNPSSGSVHAWPLAHPVLASACYSIAVVAVFLPLAVARYRSGPASR